MTLRALSSGMFLVCTPQNSGICFGFFFFSYIHILNGNFVILDTLISKVVLEFCLLFEQ